MIQTNIISNPGQRWGNIKSHISKAIKKYSERFEEDEEIEVPLTLVIWNEFTKVEFSFDDELENLSLEDILPQFEENVDLQYVLLLQEDGEKKSITDGFLKKFKIEQSEIIAD